MALPAPADGPPPANIAPTASRALFRGRDALGGQTDIPGAARRSAPPPSNGHRHEHSPPPHLRRQGQGALRGPRAGTLIQHFKDDATAFNAKKHEVIDGKGVLNNRISEYIFTNLNAIGVPTHFIKRLNIASS